ncbi:YceI family protein [Chitinophaga lutea]
MKRITTLAAFLMLLLSARGQDIQSCRNATLSFFSSAPLEDIDAKTTQGVSAVNLKTGAVYFKVQMSTFQFKKKLMQEHFNENYIESDKYPFAEFKGKVTALPDLTKDGVYPVTVEGNLTLHGVSKTYREKGTLTVKGGNVSAASKFSVRVADHNIKIPTLVVKNIAEVVEVTVAADYQPVNP